MIVPVILAGGSGGRLWPLSSTARPKQFLPLISSRTMLQDTVLRTRSIPNILPPLVICNQEHRFLVAEQLKAIGTHDATIILEPIGKNTAAAAAIAALYHSIQDPILLILPADHYIKDLEQFNATITKAMHYAKTKQFIMFGILPSRAETGYGYIKVSRLNDQTAKVYKVEQFIEKPKLESAKAYIASKQYFWNSGIFMFQASQYLSELKRFAPSILDVCQTAFANMTEDLDFIRLKNDIFSKCPNQSIDHAVMEHTQNAVLLQLETGWSDVGSWSALCETLDADLNGNILQGDVITENVKNSYLRAENRMLAVVGITDLIVVETSDVVLVTNKHNCQAVKNIVSRLKKSQHIKKTYIYRQIYRPWGHYQIIYSDKCFQIKYITVKAGARLSLQMHRHRSEHWIVVKGTAHVIRDNESFIIEENESTFIPKKTKHRLMNPNSNDIEIIEIQLGNYLQEDDIIRFEDDYGRVETQSNNKLSSEVID